jgi:hypothetical protein
LKLTRLLAGETGVVEVTVLTTLEAAGTKIIVPTTSLSPDAKVPIFSVATFPLTLPPENEERLPANVTVRTTF